MAYLVCILQNKDLLYNLAYMYKCLYDFWPHNLHLQHNRKDQHIFHFCKQVLLGILDLSSIHKVYTQCKDCLCVQEDIDTLLDDY